MKIISKEYYSKIELLPFQFINIFVRGLKKEVSHNLKINFPFILLNFYHLLSFGLQNLSWNVTTFAFHLSLWTFETPTIQEIAIVFWILLPCDRELSWPFFSTWDQSKVQLENRPFSSGSWASSAAVWRWTVGIRQERRCMSDQVSSRPNLLSEFSR